MSSSDFPKEPWGGPTRPQIAAKARLKREIERGMHRKLDDGSQTETHPLLATYVAGLGLGFIDRLLG
jgi:hypothetical protein